MSEITIKGDVYTLQETCGACPEQYDVYKDGEQVGYLRLRHGYFCAEVPGACTHTVYEAEPKGDGMFEDDERGLFLNKAIEAIHKYINSAEYWEQKSARALERVKSCGKKQ